MAEWNPIFSCFFGGWVMTAFFFPCRDTRVSIAASLFVLAFLAASMTFGQIESKRFELGRRLTRFEKAWETADSQQRADCVESMEGAVRSFFGLQLDTAASLLDQSTQRVLGTPQEASSAWLAANRYSIDFETSWLDAFGGPLRFRLRQIASSANSPKASLPKDSPWDESGDLHLEILQETKSLASGTWSGILPFSHADSIDEAWYTWQIPPLPPGNYQVSAICKSRSGTFDLISERLSISADLASRMARVSQWYEENRRSKGNTAISSARWLARELKQGEKGQPTEIDIPWNTWLEDFEALRDQEEGFLHSLAQSAPRSSWLQLSHGGKSQIVRIGLPQSSKERIPVLFAFHGAGGSENMFFEAYGAGRLIDLARERGWLVISPRQSLSGLGMDIDGMLEAIEPWLAVDRSRVMLVGHSMGAAQAIAQVSSHSDRVRAVAALGGGGLPSSSLRASSVRFFVAAGDRDFGRPRAESLSNSLRDLGCDVAYREYKDVEHLVIVQAALSDVFAFLDRCCE
jgi:predicted esterase